MDTTRFLQCNPMVQILVVRRKALRRVVICLVETLMLLWKVCFPMLNQSVKGQRLKRRQAVWCKCCEGWRRRWRLCGMGNRLRSWMG